MITLKHCLRQVYGSCIAAFLPATVIAALQFGVELAYGRSLQASRGTAVAYFVLTYVVITIGSCVASIVQTMNKTHATEEEREKPFERVRRA